STRARKKGQSRKRVRSSVGGTPSSPLPAPSQPGQMQRLWGHADTQGEACTMQRVWVHASTEGRARSDSSSPAPAASGRDAGREPISRSESSSTGVKARKKRGRSGSSQNTARHKSAE